MKVVTVYKDKKDDPLSDKGTCQLCGGPYNMMSSFDSELVGEWWVGDDDRFCPKLTSIIAHPDCAAQYGLEMA